MGDFYLNVQDGISGNFKDLRLIWAWENWCSLEDYYNPESELYVSILEDIDSAGGELFTINFSDDRFSDLEMENPQIMAVSFGLLTYKNASANIAIDIIHFPKWEEWDDSDDSDEPDLCKNNDWQVLVRTNKSSYYMDCPIDFNDPRISDSFTSLNLINGILQASAFPPAYTPEVGIGLSSISVIWAASDESENITATKIIIKITASATISDPDVSTGYVGLYIETDKGSEQWFALAKGSGFVVDEWGWPDIGDNDGEEMEIVFSEYGITGKVTSVSIWAFANNPNIASFSCDYIDFA
jgi:hypothetical protein